MNWLLHINIPVLTGAISSERLLVTYSGLEHGKIPVNQNRTSPEFKTHFKKANPPLTFYKSVSRIK